MKNQDNTIKTGKSVKELISLFVSDNKKELTKAVLIQSQLDVLALFYRRYIEVYNLKK